jgi:hypothetical protein
MDIFLKTLTKIDDFFTVKIVQIGLLILWPVFFLNSNNFLRIWILVGLAAYIILSLSNLENGFYKEIQKIKQLYNKSGWLPFSKGFNYCIILGPLSFLLYAILKEKDEN